MILDISKIVNIYGLIVVLRYFFLLFVLKNDNLKKTFYVILKTQNLNFDSIGVLSIVQEGPNTFGICKKAFKIPLTRFFVENVIDEIFIF